MTYTIEEITKDLKCTRQYIYQEINKGKLRAEKHGPGYRITEESLNEWRKSKIKKGAVNAAGN